MDKELLRELPRLVLQVQRRDRQTRTVCVTVELEVGALEARDRLELKVFGLPLRDQREGVDGRIGFLSPVECDAIGTVGVRDGAVVVDARPRSRCGDHPGRKVVAVKFRCATRVTRTQIAANQVQRDVVGGFPA